MLHFMLAVGYFSCAQFIFSLKKVGTKSNLHNYDFRPFSDLFIEPQIKFGPKLSARFQLCMLFSLFEEIGK